MVYFNFTTNVGLVCYVGTSTVATTGTFTVECQSSTGQVLLRNIWIPNGASTDLYLSVSTGANSTTLVASGLTAPQNSFFYLISASTLTLTIKNNSNNTAVYSFDGIVLRI